MESSINNDVDYLDSFPSGYRFRPFEYELINCYLKRKVKNEPLPPNRFMDVDLCKFSPELLEVMYKKGREDEMFFFTQRERKHQNGNVPNRVTNSSGFWKATGTDKKVKFKGEIIGFKKTLTFYRGAPKYNPEKTNWIMHEFRIDNAPPPPSLKNATAMKLDWVLCRIYHRRFESTRADQVREKEDHHHDDDDNSLEPMQIGSDNNGLVVVSRGHTNPSMVMAQPISIMPQEVQSTAEISQRNVITCFDTMQLQRPLPKTCSEIPNLGSMQYANPVQDIPFSTDNTFDSDSSSMVANSTQLHTNFGQNEAADRNYGVVPSTKYDYEVIESLAKMDQYLFQAYNFSGDCERPYCTCSMPTQGHYSSNIPYNNYGDAYSDTMNHPLQNGFLETSQSSNSVDAKPTLPPLPQSSLYPF